MTHTENGNFPLRRRQHHHLRCRGYCCYIYFCSVDGVAITCDNATEFVERPRVERCHYNASGCECCNDQRQKYTMKVCVPSLSTVIMVNEHCRLAGKLMHQKTD